MTMDRRSFLAGLFGTAAVALAGPIPKALLEAPEEKFLERARFFQSLKDAASGGPEVWMNSQGEYSLSPLPGFKPMREESDRIAATVLKRLYEEFFDAPST